MSKKKENIYDRYRKNRPVDIVNNIFLIYIFSVYIIFMHNMYFDITITRARTFMYGSLVYVLLFVVSYILELYMMKYYKVKPPYFYKDTPVILMPEVWMGGFLFANLMAFFVSNNKRGSWSGSTGRYFGLMMILCLTLMFVCLAREASVNKYIFGVFTFFSGASYVIACLQHFGFDPFGLRAKIVDKQKELFISTFGNINTYASYICVSLPVFAGLFIFSKKKIVRAVSGALLVLGSMAIIPAKSDNVYLGVGVGFIVLFYIAIIHKNFTEYIFSVLMVLCGLEIMAILNSAFEGSQKHINGIAEIIENPMIMLFLLILVLIILILSMLFRGVKYETYKAIQGKTFLIIFTAVMIISMIVVIIVGKNSGNELFVFNDKWGTYRGYVWTRGWYLFRDATLFNKIFGYGNETIGQLMKDWFETEMILVTNKRYDNLHNELLQYLVTTGLLGLTTYLGFLVTSFMYIGKRMKDDPILISILASCAAYAAQSLVNLNQPITTPFFFVMLATGVGYARYKAQGYGETNVISDDKK